MVTISGDEASLCGRQSRDSSAVICEGDERPFGCDVGEATEVKAGEAHGAFDDAEDRFDALPA